MRGAKILYKDLLPETETVKHRKGRSVDLNQKRNECLIDRYLFYVINNPQFSYEAIVATVSGEFFISTITLTNLLSQNHEQLMGYKKEYSKINKSTLKKHLKKRWTQYSW